MAMFLRPVFSDRVHNISDLHSKFALGPRHVWNYDRHPSLRPLGLGEEKTKKKKEERNQTKI